MNKVFLYSHNPKSQGAKRLAEALGIRCIKHNNSRFQPSPDKIIINWGSSQGFDLYQNRVKWINHPFYVMEVQNKLWFFRGQDVNSKARIVPWTTRQDVAQEWNLKFSVVVRNLLTSSAGRGIIVVPPNGQIPEAPLYTKYIPKDAEFRVHIVGGEIIDVQRKIRDPNREPTNWKIRSHSNGFIFIRQGIHPSDDVLEQSKLAFSATGLDFGAVDIITNKEGQAFVLEVNSAPGIEETTVIKYKEALTKLIIERQNETMH